jgi:hypothetical protein
MKVLLDDMASLTDEYATLFCCDVSERPDDYTKEREVLGYKFHTLLTTCESLSCP